MEKIMSYEFLEPGYKVMVVHRKLFKEDQSRIFVGWVEAFNENSGLLRVKGYTWAPAVGKSTMVKKNEPRVKIVALNSGTFIVYVLPSATDIESLSYEENENIQWITDGKNFRLNMNENV